MAKVLTRSCKELRIINADLRQISDRLQKLQTKKGVEITVKAKSLGRNDQVSYPVPLEPGSTLQADVTLVQHIKYQ